MHFPDDFTLASRSSIYIMGVSDINPISPEEDGRSAQCQASPAYGLSSLGGAANGSRPFEEAYLRQLSHDMTSFTTPLPTIDSPFETSLLHQEVAEMDWSTEFPPLQVDAWPCDIEEDSDLLLAMQLEGCIGHDTSTADLLDSTIFQEPSLSGAKNEMSSTKGDSTQKEDACYQEDASVSGSSLTYETPATFPIVTSSSTDKLCSYDKPSHFDDLTDEHVKSMPYKDLIALASAKGLDAKEIDELKGKRRRLKNRKSAKKSSDRKRFMTHSLGQQNVSLRSENARLRREKHKLSEENAWLKEVNASVLKSQQETNIKAEQLSLQVQYLTKLLGDLHVSCGERRATAESA